MTNISSQYRNIRDWVDYLFSLDTKPSAHEATIHLAALSAKWELCVYYTWGDDALKKLVDFYPEPVWLTQVTKYFIQNIEDLLDNANWKETIWRFYEIFHKIGPDWQNYKSDNSEFTRWQALAKGSVEPATLDEHWVSLMLGDQSPEVLSQKLAEMLELQVVVFPSNYNLVQYLCEKVNDIDQFAKGTTSYTLLAKNIAKRAHWHWLGSGNDNLTIDIADVMLEKSKGIDLLKWYCLGLINPRILAENAQNPEKYAINSELFAPYMKEQTAWFLQQADLVLDIYMIERAAFRGFMHDTAPFTWLVEWMQESGTFNQDDIHEDIPPEHAVLWWLKPEWRMHKPIVEALQLSLDDIIDFCKATVPPSLNLKDRSNLPDSLDF